MKATFLTIIFFWIGNSWAQQIGNSDFENWDNLGSNQEEPTNWSSFKTATGSFSAFASKQVERSTAIRSGATGNYCARIWSKSTLGIMANGVLTTGRMNMGSSSLSSPDNFNYTLLGDAAFSESITMAPDSIVFWAKYAALPTEKAGMHAFIHDQFSVQDPLNSASVPFIVAEADLQFSPTGGNWQRFSVPFVYTANTGLAPKYILLTFTTNHIPGGGSANDEVWIDDVELVYNTNHLQVDLPTIIQIYLDDQNRLRIEGIDEAEKIEVYSLNGQLYKQMTVGQILGATFETGYYLIRCAGSNMKLFFP